jgi:ABC-type branched-subunit amino acid transport system permease subunit
MFRAILIPFLILSLAALGVNILVGYCGQISLGSGAFMAVGAYAAYNCLLRIDGIPLIFARMWSPFEKAPDAQARTIHTADCDLTNMLVFTKHQAHLSYD